MIRSLVSFEYLINFLVILACSFYTKDDNFVDISNLLTLTRIMTQDLLEADCALTLLSFKVFCRISWQVCEPSRAV